MKNPVIYLLFILSISTFAIANEKPDGEILRRGDLLCDIRLYSSVSPAKVGDRVFVIKRGSIQAILEIVEDADSFWIAKRISGELLDGKWLYYSSERAWQHYFNRESLTRLQKTHEKLRSENHEDLLYHVLNTFAQEYRLPFRRLPETEGDWAFMLGEWLEAIYSKHSPAEREAILYLMRHAMALFIEKSDIKKELERGLQQFQTSSILDDLELMLAISDLKGKRIDEASFILRRFLYDHPQSPWLYVVALKLSSIMIEMHSPEKALVYLNAMEKEKSIRSLEAQFRLLQYLCLLETGQNDKAMGIMERLYQQASDPYELQWLFYEQFRIAIRADYTEQARWIQEQLQMQFPKSPWLPLMRYQHLLQELKEKDYSQKTNALYKHWQSNIHHETGIQAYKDLAKTMALKRELKSLVNLVDEGDEIYPEKKSAFDIRLLISETLLSTFTSYHAGGENFLAVEREVQAYDRKKDLLEYTKALYPNSRYQNILDFIQTRKPLNLSIEAPHRESQINQSFALARYYMEDIFLQAESYDPELLSKALLLYDEMNLAFYRLDHRLDKTLNSFVDEAVFPIEALIPLFVRQFRRLKSSDKQEAERLALVLLKYERSRPLSLELSGFFKDQLFNIKQNEKRYSYMEKIKNAWGFEDVYLLEIIEYYNGLLEASASQQGLSKNARQVVVYQSSGTKQTASDTVHFSATPDNLFHPLDLNKNYQVEKREGFQIYTEAGPQAAIESRFLELSAVKGQSLELTLRPETLHYYKAVHVMWMGWDEQSWTNEKKKVASLPQMPKEGSLPLKMEIILDHVLWKGEIKRLRLEFIPNALPVEKRKLYLQSVRLLQKSS